MAEIYVTSTADSGTGTLRAAINAARNGDVILFDSAVFPVGQTTSILLSSSFTFSYNITIDADEPVEYLGVVREVDGVDTIVEITHETPAQEGEHPVRFLRCRVALDGQDGRRVATVSTNRAPTLRGLEMTRGLGSGALLNIYGGSTTTLINCSVIRGTSSQASAPIAFSTGTQIFKNCVFALNQGRGVIWNNGDSVQTFEGCCFVASHTDQSGGALRFDGQAAGEAVLDDCDFIDNSANQNGGAIYTAKTKQVTLNNCSIIDCSANRGGGVCSTGTSQNTLNDCTISGCAAPSDGGALYSSGSSTNTLINCTLNNNTATNPARRDIVVGETSALYLNATKSEALFTGANTDVTICNGVTSVADSTFNGAAITIADGAALTLTGTAFFNNASFTSDGRAYLAVAPGIAASGATLNNVVLCEYGAGVTAFRATKDAATWTATDSTISVLLEKRVGETWTTVAQTPGTSYSGDFPGATLRIFDGAQFVTTIATKLHAWLEYTQSITVATATAKAYETTVQSAPRYKIKKGYVMASQYYNRGEAPVFFARIEDSETSAIVPKSSVSSISYTAYRVTTSWSTEKRTPVEGHENVAVDLSAYLAALVVDDPRWTEDTTGYNFIFEPDTTEHPIFPDGGKYVVVVTIEFTGANPAPISYEIEVK